MEQLGFREGNILEPSCGIGHFIGMLPDSMSESKIYGVELDTVSAGIAQQLYQKTSIAAQGFEEANLPDSFFDAVVGNVPFGDFKVPDKRYDKHKFLIHDYFFAKSLDKLRPGGVMALITSKGTIKTIDKAAVAGQRMKQAYISTKDKAEHSTSAAENSVDEYAADKFERGVDTAVQEINTEYDNKLLEIRNGNTYDVLEMSGSRAVWKEVLSVYSVKVNTDPDNPQEVATMDDSKKQLLKAIF